MRAALLPIVFVAACGGESVSVAPMSTPSPTPAATASAAGHGHDPAWSYEGATSPQHWAELAPSFSECASGKKQSPIDLPTVANAEPMFNANAEPAVKWGLVPAHVDRTGHGWRIAGEPSSEVGFGDGHYRLAQFHFHAPSEHTIAGRSFAAEIHFVHKRIQEARDGDVAGKPAFVVVGLLFDRGQDNAYLAPFLAAAKGTVDGPPVDIRALMPKRPHWLTYEGSLTTPPCSEGIQWLVVAPDDGTTQLSDAQIATIGELAHGPSSRPVQPLNGRHVSSPNTAY